MGVNKIRFPETSGIGIKPVSEEGTSRLVRAAIEYAIENGRKSVTLVHKGNIMKFTEGAFKTGATSLPKENTEIKYSLGLNMTALSKKTEKKRLIKRRATRKRQGKSSLKTASLIFSFSRS